MTNPTPNKIPTSHFPTPEFRFFLYDPEGDGFIYYRSAADRDADSISIIRQYLDDYWMEEVEQVIAGEITHTCQMINKQERPSPGQLDEDSCAEDGTYWGHEYDFICDYGLVAIGQPETGVAHND